MSDRSAGREAIYAEVDAERARQDEQWGGADHDAQHNGHDWIRFIVRHAGFALIERAERGRNKAETLVDFTAAHFAAVVTTMASGTVARDTFRRQMVRVAALAVAALEWLERVPTKDPVR